MGEGKKYSELVLEERKKGNVVFLAVDTVMSSPVKEIIKQPVDGLLWDLNRDEATALTFMDREGMVHWVNNFAVALVIRELKSQLTQLEEENERLRMSEGYYRTGATQTKKRCKRPEYVPKRIFIPRTVRSDVPDSSVAVHRGEYDAHVNQYGAVSIKITDDSFLGIMLYEFDVIEWQENPALQQEQADDRPEDSNGPI